MRCESVHPQAPLRCTREVHVGTQHESHGRGIAHESTGFDTVRTERWNSANPDAVGVPTEPIHSGSNLDDVPPCAGNHPTVADILACDDCATFLGELDKAALDDAAEG